MRGIVKYVNYTSYSLICIIFISGKLKGTSDVFSTISPSDKIRMKDSTRFVYPRNALKRMNALWRSGFKCEINPQHESFTSRNTGFRYMETHHLIPLEFWRLFENNLDVEANIVCLCSNCHNEIHYGTDAEYMIKILYKKRRKELEEAKISVPEELVLQMYSGIIDKNKES